MTEYIVELNEKQYTDLRNYRREEIVRCRDCKHLYILVRCRDCKHLYIPQWDEMLAAEYGAPPIVCERTGDMDDVEPDGFCAWGEQKEGGDE